MTQPLAGEAPIRVAILDDHLSTIYGHRYALQGMAGVRVVGTAQWGEELEPLLAEHETDVLLLDVGVPTSATNDNPYPILYLVPQLLERYPDLAVVIISMRGDKALAETLLESGISGYILKDDSAAIQELPTIVRLVAQGGIYLSERIRQRLSKRQTGPSEPLLSPRQLEALSLSAAYPHETTALTARRMGVQHSTCRNLLSTAYLRLGVSNRTTAILKAQQMGLLPQIR